MNANLRAMLGGAGLLAAAATPATGQMVTDRPDFTESTATVADGRFQLEAGYTYTSISESSEHVLGEALLRMGLIPGLELRAQLPSYVRQQVELGPLEREADGFSDAAIGMKLGLYEAGMAEGLPSVSLLLSTTVPTGDGDLTDDAAADGWQPEATLALGWELAPRVDLGANVKYAQRNPDVGDRYDEWAASVALGLPVTSALGAFIEYFAIRPDFEGDAGDDDYIDGGLTFLLSPTFQLDGRIGFNLDGDADEMFFGVGFAKLF